MITVCPPRAAGGLMPSYTAAATKDASRVPVKCFPNLNPDVRLHRISTAAVCKLIPLATIHVVTGAALLKVLEGACQQTV